MANPLLFPYHTAEFGPYFLPNMRILATQDSTQDIGLELYQKNKKQNIHSTTQQNFSLTIHQNFGYTRQHMRMWATQDSTHDIGLHAAQAHEPKNQRTGFAMPQTLTRDLGKKIHRTTSRLRALARYIYTHTRAHICMHITFIYIYTHTHTYVH